jgi:MFS family permease
MPRDVYVLALIGFFVAVGFGVVAPVIPVFASSFGVSEFAASAVISAFALMRLVASPFVARMGERWGERNVLITGVVIVAVSSVLAGTARTYPALLIWRGVGGIGSAMFSVSAMTLLLAVVAAEYRGRANALYNSGFIVGMITGPVVGGFFAAISLGAPFFFYAATLAVSAVVGVVLLRAPALEMEDADGTTTKLPPSRPLRDVLRDARYQAACLIAFAGGWTANGLRGALVPLFVAGYLFTDPAEATRWTGITMAASAATQAVLIGPAGIAIDRFGRRVPLLIGCLISGVTMTVVPYAPSMAVVIVILCGYAVASSVMGSAPAATVGDAAGPRSGRAVALFSMSSDIGSILGPLGAGALVTLVGYPIAFATAAVLWALCTAMTLRMPSDWRRVGSAQEEASESSTSDGGAAESEGGAAGR